MFRFEYGGGLLNFKISKSFRYLLKGNCSWSHFRKEASGWMQCDQLHPVPFCWWKIFVTPVSPFNVGLKKDSTKCGKQRINQHIFYLVNKTTKFHSLDKPCPTRSHGYLFYNAQIFTESIISDASLPLFSFNFHVLDHWLRPFQNAVCANVCELIHGLPPAFPASGKYPFVPPTARFRIT